jgi:putative ABC transport system permease protein
MRRPIAQGLIRLVTTAAERGPLLGDLEEVRARLEQSHGRRGADRWFLRQAILVAAYAARGHAAATWSTVTALRWGPRDLRYAARALVRTPAFTIIAVVSLAVGVGATTAMFGLVYAVLLEPLAVPHAEQLAVLERTSVDGRDDRFSYREYTSLQSVSPAADLAVDASISNVPFTIDGRREYLTTDFVGGNYFRMLGIRPRLGRFVDVADEEAGARVLVISEGIWDRSFNRSPSVVGATVDIKAAPFTVIGVAPASFRGLDYPGSFAAAIPAATARTIGLPDYLRQAEPAFGIVGRPSTRHTSATLAALDAAFQRCCHGAVAEHLAFVGASYGIGGKDDMRAELRGSLMALLGAVVLLLVVACVNVANLLIIRGTRRTRELALRLSLGASRARVVQQLLAESVLLAVVGGGAGLGLAAGGRALLSANLPRNFDVMTEVVRFHVDAPVMLCTIVTALLTVLLAGVVPAMHATQVEIASVTKAGDRITAATGGHRWERVGVRLQVALALLLLSTASLLAGTLSHLSAIDTGLRAQDVFVLAVETRGTSLEAAGIVPIHSDILERLHALPGVDHAAMATFVPFFGGRRSTRQLELIDKPADPIPDVVMDAVTPDFFAAIGIPVVAGRDFGPADASGSGPVVVLSESVAQRLGGGHDLVGRHVRVSGQRSEVATVIGIARDAKLNDVRSAAPLVFYAPVTQTGMWPFLEVAIRAPLASPGFDRQLHAVVHAVAPDARLRFGSTLETELRAALAPERLAAVLALIFAVIALGLAAIGLYGVVAQQVSSRTSEFGVRVALGASGADLAAMVARHGAALVGTGLAIGVPLAMLAGRLLAPELYGVRSWEPSVLTAAVGIVIVTSALALAVPAHRAAKTDPLIAIKGE